MIHRIALVLSIYSISEVSSIWELTSDPYSLGSFCSRPVSIICTGTETAFLIFWKNGSADITQYGFRSSDTNFPITLNLNTPIQGVTAEVTTASTSSSNPNTIDIVTKLTASDVSILNGYSISCQDGAGVQSKTLDITVGSQDIPTPPSDALCSVLSSTEGITFDLQLDLPYIMRYSVENYRVRVEPQISSCLDGLLSPGDAYSCIGLAIGTNYTFSVSAVNCINQIGATHTINVQPLVPRAPLGVTVSPIYTSRSQAAQLEELLVQWENMEQVPVAKDCEFDNELNYTIVVEEYAGTAVTMEQSVISSGSDSCVNGLCETSFAVTENSSYVVSLTATNELGFSSVTVESATVVPTLQFNFELSFGSCKTRAKCSYNSGENCTVRFSENSDYSKLSEGTTGPVNTRFDLPIMGDTKQFFYQAMVKVDSYTIIQIRKPFTTGEYDARFTVANYAMLVVGMFFWCMAVLLLTLEVRFLRVPISYEEITMAFVWDNTFGSKARWLWMVLMVEVVLLVLCLVMWIVVVFQVGFQENTCDPSWKSTRDGLTIISVLFPLLAVVILVGMAVFRSFVYDHKATTPVDPPRVKTKPPPIAKPVNKFITAHHDVYDSETPTQDIPTIVDIEGLTDAPHLPPPKFKFSNDMNDFETVMSESHS